MSNVQVHLIEATVHGRYLLRPAAAGNPAGVLVGFHGYGESAMPMLEALLEIPGVEAWAVASIEGLHPFYTRSGEVVASWMTKQDREAAIADNVAYVASAVGEIVDAAGMGMPLVYAGFSQGVAMAYRAAAGAGHPCHGLFALAGDVPPELAERDLDGFPRVLIGRGTGDSWYTEEKLTADVQLLRSKGVDVEFERFEGGHEWTPAFHRRCADLLAVLTRDS